MISLLCYINLRKLGDMFAGSHYNYTSTSISKQSPRNVEGPFNSGNSERKQLHTKYAVCMSCVEF